MLEELKFSAPQLIILLPSLFWVISSEGCDCCILASSFDMLSWQLQLEANAE